MKYLKIILVIILFMATTDSCSNAKRKCGDETRTQVLIKTSEGEITIELYNETPFHRDNFIKLVEENYYDGVLFHRVIKEFMVQAGDPDSKNAPADKQLGAGGPDYVIPAEFVYPQLFHKKGALSAARQADQVNPMRSSSGSQFYIVTGKKYSQSELTQMESQMTQQEMQSHFQRLCMENRDSILEMQKKNDRTGLQSLQEKFIRIVEDSAKSNGGVHYTQEQVQTYTTVGGTPFLDNQYTVFGQVIDGMDVVEKIEKSATNAQDRPKKDIKIISTKILK